jgi:ankyrin repeat protein
VKNDERDTTIYKAVEYRDKGVIRLFLEEAADIETENKDGWTVLIRSIWEWEELEAIIQLLLEKGADVDAAASDGSTALYGVLCCHART